VSDPRFWNTTSASFSPVAVGVILLPTAATVYLPPPWLVNSIGVKDGTEEPDAWEMLV
jgi:hypothetical protein